VKLPTLNRGNKGNRVNDHCAMYPAETPTLAPWEFVPHASKTEVLDHRDTEAPRLRQTGRLSALFSVPRCLGGEPPCFEAHKPNQNDDHLESKPDHRGLVTR